MQKKLNIIKNMSAQGMENRKGCNRRVIWFFIFAIACVVAFLIVGLVKTCNAEHEEKEYEEIQQEQEAPLPQSAPVQTIE